MHVYIGCVLGQTWDEVRDKSNKIGSMLVIIEAGWVPTVGYLLFSLLLCMFENFQNVN